MPWTAAVGHHLTRVLGINLDAPAYVTEDVDEDQPTVTAFLRKHRPTLQGTQQYAVSLFPCAAWIGRYNMQWLVGDVVAGVTIGAVVVPQSLAYARLATLDVQYGLYASLMGHLLYWVFGTSKDISIGPIAIMSVMTGKAVVELHPVYPDVPPHMIASCLAVVAGCLLVLLGLLRLGWLLDLVPLVSLVAFVTGSAVTIGSGQLATLLGISGVKTSEAPAYVIINTLKHLPDAHGTDAAVGLSSLVLLYLIRFGSNRLAKRYPKRARVFFFAATLRTVFVILLFTLISWIVNRNRADDGPLFKILMTVPAGFQHVGIPPLTPRLIRSLASYLPSVIVVLLLEHMAVARAFGRHSRYTIRPSQEMLAIGVGNVAGAFLGGYAVTGSFSRTAIQAKAGAKTPACGAITAAIVLLAVYVLPPVFYYIPSATLAAVIVHAVGDLVTPPSVLYDRFWRVAPVEVPIFVAGVVVAIVSSVDIGLYTTAGLSLAVLLARQLRSSGQFMGRTRTRVNAVDGQQDASEGDTETEKKSEASSAVVRLSSPLSRNVFLPRSQGSVSDHPGVFVYRFRDGLAYPSAAHTLTHMVANITEHARPGPEQATADRVWSDPPAATEPPTTGLPPLLAVILDFSAVHHIDATAVQQLVDTRAQLDRFAAPDTVEWHMACVQSPWTRRALVAANFRPVFHADVASAVEAAVTARRGNGGDGEGGEV